MSKLIRFAVDLYNDGFKLIGLLAPLLSLATTIAHWLGVKVGDVNLQEIAWGWFLIPAMLWLLVAYVRRRSAYHQHVDGPRPEAKSLPQISVTEIAKYLLEKSEWGWNEYRKYSSRDFVKANVPHEMRRAGISNEIRYIGVEPNGVNSVEIDRAYWQNAIFDGDRIWDDRNRFFTEDFGGTVFNQSINYQHGTAPRCEVYRTWPTASYLKKRWTSIIVPIRKWWLDG